MRQVSEALPRPQLIPQDLRHRHECLRGYEVFEDKDTSFDDKWLLHQIKLATLGIKEEGH